VTYAGPVLALGLWLLGWAAVWSRPDRFAWRGFWLGVPRWQRRPARTELIAGATIWGLVDIAAASVMFLARLDDGGAAPILLAANAIGVISLLAAAAAKRRRPRA